MHGAIGESSQAVAYCCTCAPRDACSNFGWYPAASYLFAERYEVGRIGHDAPKSAASVLSLSMRLPKSWCPSGRRASRPRSIRIFRRVAFQQAIWPSPSGLLSTMRATFCWSVL